jgi:hypothetical protein
MMMRDPVKCVRETMLRDPARIEDLKRLEVTVISVRVRR